MTTPTFRAIKLLPVCYGCVTTEMWNFNDGLHKLVKLNISAQYWSPPLCSRPQLGEFKGTETITGHIVLFLTIRIGPDSLILFNTFLLTLTFAYKDRETTRAFFFDTAIL